MVEVSMGNDGWRRRFQRTVDWIFRGDTSPWVYVVLRLGLAGILLVRHSDWLRPWIFLEHHRWVRGLEFMWSVSSDPPLESPLWPGLAIGKATTLVLVCTRTALALMLLAGVRARLTAALLAGVCYLLFAADRYRYFNHLHLLYFSIALLSLAPIGDGWNLERGIRRAWAALRSGPRDGRLAPPISSPLWPLQLVRALVMSIYLASGLSKLDAAWLRGETLALLHRFNALGGPTWMLLHEWFGYGGIAKLTCLTELALPGLLAYRVTRRPAVVVAASFHALISACMMVSTFGVQMVVLLLAFWPNSRTPSDESTGV